MWKREALLLVIDVVDKEWSSSILIDIGVLDIWALYFFYMRMPFWFIVLIYMSGLAGDVASEVTVFFGKGKWT